MNNQRQRMGGYLWGLSGLLMAIGIIMHPPLTVEGMLRSIWVPDHAIIMVSLIALIFALNLITFGRPYGIGPLAWSGYLCISLSAFLFIGIVYFELFLIPKLAVDLPELFDNGLRIGPLKAVLPITALLFVIGHITYGVPLIKQKLLPMIPFLGLIIFSAPLAFKPVLPDLVATVGAVGYGLFAVYFAIQYAKMPLPTSG
jgi:hypothetical protein